MDYLVSCDKMYESIYFTLFLLSYNTHIPTCYFVFNPRRIDANINIFETYYDQNFTPIIPLHKRTYHVLVCNLYYAMRPKKATDMG